MRSIVAILITLSALSAYSQTTKYYQNNSLGLVNLEDHLNIDFTWNIHGKTQTFMNEGLEQLRNGNIPSAARNFNEVINQSPDFWPAYYYRGICYKNVRKVTEAEKDLKKSLELNPACMEGKLELAEIYDYIGGFDKAREIYLTVLKEHPTSLTAHFYLANLLAEINEMQEADAEYAKCNELDPKFPGSYYAQGIIAAKKDKNNARCMKYLDKALEADSLFKPAIFTKALLYRGEQKFGKSIEAFDKLIRLQPGNLRLYEARGLTLIEAKRYDDGFADVKKIVSARRAQSGEYTGETNIFDRRADLETAVDYLTKKGYGLKDDSFSLIKKGYCLLLTNRLQEALDALDDAIKIEPSAPAFLLKAMILNQTGGDKNVIEYYSKALELDNDIFEAHEKRVLYLWNRKDWKGVAIDLAEMRRMKPDSRILLRFSGMLNSNTGNFQGCVQDLSAFLKTDVDKDAAETLIYCYRKIGDNEHATQVEQLYRSPYNPIIQKAQYYLDQNQIDSVDVCMRMLLLEMNKSLKPPDDEDMANVYYVSSQLAFARKMPEKALQLIHQAIHDSRVVDPKAVDAKKIFLRMKVYIALGKTDKAKEDYEILKNLNFKEGQSYYEQFNKPEK